jgi:hypothetical protein
MAPPIIPVRVPSIWMTVQEVATDSGCSVQTAEQRLRAAYRDPKARKAHRLERERLSFDGKAHHWTYRYRGEGVLL